MPNEETSNDFLFYSKRLMIYKLKKTILMFCIFVQVELCTNQISNEETSNNFLFLNVMRNWT